LAGFFSRPNPTGLLAALRLREMGAAGAAGGEGAGAAEEEEAEEGGAAEEEVEERAEGREGVAAPLVFALCA
jgi:hypothetical protein